MSTNLVRITIPKKSINNLHQTKPNPDQNSQTHKKEVKRFFPPNSKSLKVDNKFKSKISKENNENDKNAINVVKHEVTKKLTFEKHLNPNPSKTSIGFNRIPSGKITTLKELTKNERSRVNSTTSKKDVEMKNETFLIQDEEPQKMDVDKKYEPFNTFNYASYKGLDSKTINFVEEKKSFVTIGTSDEEETTIDIDEFLDKAGRKLEENKRVGKTNLHIADKKDEEEPCLESLNEQNLKINFQCKPEFQTEEYRNLVSQLIKRDYSSTIIKNLLKEEECIEEGMTRHKITERMRTRMVDWMIEVLSNYKCDEHTFFLSVNIMDRYFKSCTKTLQPNDLHGIGVGSMFIASKFYDVYPLRLKVVYEKIAHKKLSCDEIKNLETEIASALNYVIGKPTVWEFINFYLDELFYRRENNFNVKDKSLLSYIGTEQGSISSDFPFELYTENMIKLLRLVVIYLAKMNCHDHNLVSKKPSLLAGSTLFVALKICEQINKENYVTEYFFRKLTDISKKSQSEIIKCAQKILYNAQNFDSIFSGLENLKKIHFNAIIEVKETK